MGGRVGGRVGGLVGGLVGLSDRKRKNVRCFQR